MTKVNIAEFKKRMSKYLSAVEKGEEIILARRNEPVARISAVAARMGRKRNGFGCMRGTVKISGDIVAPAFDEDDWEMLR